MQVKPPHVAPVVTRRRSLLALLGAPALLSWSPPVGAGGQLEEALANSVQLVLRQAVSSDAPPKVGYEHFSNTEERLKFIRWKMEMSQRLSNRKSDLRTLQERDDFLQTLWWESKLSRLDAALVLGLVQVESNFRKYAVSSVGARGYMQVMPFWTRQIGDGDPSKLFHMQTNLRFGCVILRLYLDMERNDPFLALGRYNGSRGKPQYPDAVQGARRHWEMAA
jgi:soluble lytic murein transglycosylase-like protein